MKLKINAVHFTADNSLLEFIQRKLDKLDTFYDRIIGADVYLKLEKGNNSKIQTKLIEVDLKMPGKNIFVKEEGESFEEATDLAVVILTRQVKKVKQKSSNKNHEKPTLTLESVDEDLD